MPWAAGITVSEITPEPGVELMGYGARIGKSTAVHDRLWARALYLTSDAQDSAEQAVLVVSADLCLMAPQQAAEIRSRIGGQTGLSPGQILVGCTHTHSGPDTGLAALSAGRDLPHHCGPILGGIVQAAVEAVREAQPASFRWTRAEAAIGRNRRLADGPVNGEILILEVRGADGAPRAVLFQHGCHGTVLGHDNLEISADWPGVAVAEIERRTGARALFLLGAHADIDPRTRGLMDLVIPGQSVGLGFDAVRVLGLEVAEAVLDALDKTLDPPEAGPVRAASTTVRLPLHLGDRPPSEARAELERRKRELAELLDLNPENFPRLSGLSAVVDQRVRSLPLGEARRRVALARLYLRDKTGPFFVGGERELDVEAQVVRIGDTALLGLPLEPTTNVGLDWQRRATRILPRAGVSGIANGWLRYLPHADDFAHPRANEHYEVLQSTFAPGACEKLLDAGERLLETLT